MELRSLPEIVFVSGNKDEIIAELTSLYKDITGRTLAQGDPIRLFLSTIAAAVIQSREYINLQANKIYCGMLQATHWIISGYWSGAERLPASAATTTVKITLSEARATSTLVPAGTRITAGDNVFLP